MRPKQGQFLPLQFTLQPVICLRPLTRATLRWKVSCAA